MTRRRRSDEEKRKRIRIVDRVSDHCASCGKRMLVIHRAWENMTSFWGKVFTAWLCRACCKADETPLPEDVAQEITKRQYRIRSKRKQQAREKLDS